MAVGPVRARIAKAQESVNLGIQPELAVEGFNQAMVGLPA